MIQIFLGIFIFLGGLSLFSGVSASMVYIPSPSIEMTGSNDTTFFDVAADLTNSGITDKYPILNTATKNFSWAFYLSWAGWSLLNTGMDHVSLDCGAQALGNLTASCVLSGTGWNENIGDIIFDRRVIFDHNTGLLSWSASTYLGDYSFSGVRLPLIYAEFTEGRDTIANHMQSLSISGGISRYGGWTSSWLITLTPQWQPGYSRSYPLASFSALDLSLAVDYDAEIRDSQGSTTTFVYRVIPWTPSTSLESSPFLKKVFCTANPTSLFCPDGAAQSPMILTKTSSAPSIIANGSDTYTLILKIRDRYGNATSGGSVRIEYTDRVWEIQESSWLGPYISYGPWYAISGGGDMSWPANEYGRFVFASPIIRDIEYTFSSIAPTLGTNTLFLSWILYTDSSSITTDITLPAWRSPLVFAPWYSSTLSIPWAIEVGSGVGFSRSLTSVSALTEPSIADIYDIDIGTDNSLASFSLFQWVTCSKLYLALGIGVCDWSDMFGVFVSPSSTTFTGTYTSNTSYPILEPVSYQSYVTYQKWGVRILYPSSSGSLGTATYGKSAMKILWQNNLGIQYSGIWMKSKWEIWNTLHKNTTLHLRNRTTYADTDYTIYSTNISVDNTAFASKRSIIVVWWDITVSGNIDSHTQPLAIIALADASGNGGNIIIDPRVTDIHASLFSEHSVSSSGDRQLYIRGSLISNNTAWDTQAGICPYYVTVTCDSTEARKYDLEYIRPGFDLATSQKSISQTALANPWVALLIEYDGRLMWDPPPGLTN